MQAMLALASGSQCLCLVIHFDPTAPHSDTDTHSHTGHASLFTVFSRYSETQDCPLVQALLALASGSW